MLLSHIHIKYHKHEINPHSHVRTKPALLFPNSPSTNIALLFTHRNACTDTQAQLNPRARTVMQTCTQSVKIAECAEVSPIVGLNRKMGLKDFQLGVLSTVSARQDFTSDPYASNTEAAQIHRNPVAMRTWHADVPRVWNVKSKKEKRCKVFGEGGWRVGKGATATVVWWLFRHLRHEMLLVPGMWSDLPRRKNKNVIML